MNEDNLTYDEVIMSESPPTLNNDSENSDSNYSLTVTED